jgi:hypothetical protein
VRAPYPEVRPHARERALGLSGLLAEAGVLVFMGKSRLDSRSLGAIYTPWCRVAFGGRSNGQEAAAKKQRQ